jgi:hypothetical protein
MNNMVIYKTKSNAGSYKKIVKGQVAFLIIIRQSFYLMRLDTTGSNRPSALETKKWL